jgi:DNA-binding Lrp family transcriptional regulator
MVDLAQQVRLNVAPCYRRLRELKRAGVTCGYRAVVDPAPIGLGFQVLAHVTMDREDAAMIAETRNGVQRLTSSIVLKRTWRSDPSPSRLTRLTHNPSASRAEAHRRSPGGTSSCGWLSTSASRRT